ncbi:hypothetical protein [Azospira inquinata]|uniref:Uncharacterized protein n=1 Tax=Azospira inquinata TaxID=2785627 RepID=A0A975SPV1_9RHOO|nr:hypothetical protein [Azospira inquinata]QWT47064.1 hypothetical protein J8L76_04970 [Azospira inquinata]QWT50307.1 hypothetical protein Azoinq_06900 [Azospira inquinata]
MADILDDYREALERLKKGRPIKVTKGTKITNDSVSLEAGRKKGTIKRSRPIFKDLIAEIDAAGAEQSNPKDESKAKLTELKAEVMKYRTLWEEALTREVSLVKQLWDERQEWSKEKAMLTGEKVTAINRRKMER